MVRARAQQELQSKILENYNLTAKLNKTTNTCYLLVSQSGQDLPARQSAAKALGDDEDNDDDGDVEVVEGSGERTLRLRLIQAPKIPLMLLERGDK